jgi:pimeloyl-ACP methyl ester carboxylesterase
MTMDTVSGTPITFHRQGSGRLAVLLVHGFLDDHRVWDEVIDELADLAVEFISVDLAGCGERADAPGPFTYQRLADDTRQIASAVNKPLVIVGQSMGAAVSELVATQLPQLVRGLILLAPVPLAGTQLPDAELESFAALGDNGAKAQRLIRRQLSFALSDEKVDALTAAVAVTRADVIRALAHSWDSGHPDGQHQSAHHGPVLILSGRHDPIVTSELIATAIAPRFADVRSHAIDEAGHWPHAEQPGVVASWIRQFVAEHGGQQDHAVGDRHAESKLGCNGAGRESG